MSCSRREAAKLFDPGAGFIPPDTCGAVGLDHFVEVVNTHLSVFEKSTGNRVVNVALNTLFGVGGIAGDPRVVWDTHSQRFFIIATNFDDRIYLAVSLTSDPTGSFFTTQFLTSQGIDSGKFPDYPALGVVGSVWNFQFWYRDPGFGSAGFNLTDAIELTFCD